MNDDSKPKELIEYFSIDGEILKPGSRLPFDCFIYLEKNRKILHWLHHGSVIGPDSKEKLQKLENFQFLVKNTQKADYLKYVSSRSKVDTSNKQLTRIIDDEPLRKFANMKLKLDSSQSPTKPTIQSPKIRVDAEFLNVVITSSILVFNELCKVTVTLTSSTKRHVNAASLLQVDVASFVALSSQSIRGTIGLCFPEQTYLYLLNKATGLEFSEVTTELAMGAGEFIYQIFETARPILIDRGYEIDRAVPSLVADHNLSVPHVMPDPGFSVLFNSPGGPFQFEIGIKTGA